MNDRIKIARDSTPQNKMEGEYWGIKKPVRSATSTKITNRYGKRIALTNIIEKYLKKNYRTVLIT
jgi:hypothetical protein